MYWYLGGVSGGYSTSPPPIGKPVGPYPLGHPGASCGNRVPACIDGKRVLLPEADIRALQVLCKRITEDEGFDAYLDFCSRVQIYASEEKVEQYYSDKYQAMIPGNIKGDNDMYTMHFRPDGKFANDFAPKYDVYAGNTRLLIEVL